MDGTRYLHWPLCSIAAGLCSPRPESLEAAWGAGLGAGPAPGAPGEEAPGGRAQGRSPARPRAGGPRAGRPAGGGPAPSFSRACEARRPRRATALPSRADLGRGRASAAAQAGGGCWVGAILGNAGVGGGGGWGGGPGCAVGRTIGAPIGLIRFIAAPALDLSGSFYP